MIKFKLALLLIYIKRLILDFRLINLSISLGSSSSELVPDGHPAVVEIVSSPKDLQVVSVGDQSFSDVVDLFWFL